MIRVELGKPKYKAWGKQTGTRQGVMIHYDASKSDVGAVAWLEDDERVRVSYHFLVLDDGRILQIAPTNARAWHAGVCKPSRKEFTYSDGNNAFYGVSIAATDGEVATLAQLNSVAGLCHYLFWLEGWNEQDTWRITGHNAEAFPRGRKSDPEGSDPSNPVLSVQHVRTRFAQTQWTGIP